VCLCILEKLFLGDDGAVGAAVAARAAVQASTSVDDVLIVTLGNSTSGADISAGTAADASRSDLVSHSSTSIRIVTSLYHTIQKKQVVRPNSQEDFCSDAKICKTDTNIHFAQDFSCGSRDLL
jgi:hypothetical protein